MHVDSDYSCTKGTQFKNAKSTTTCCVSFEDLQWVKHLQNMLLLFVILYFDEMSCYNIFIMEDFCVAFVNFMLRM